MKKNGIQRLWAPWRLAYIKDEKRGEKCPFCACPKGTPSAENLVLWRDQDIAVLMNKFPYNPGHLLIIPRAHVSDPRDLSAKVWAKCSRALTACLEILETHQKPQGFNIGMNLGAAAGAGIPGHMHWHILPRWPGDTNFMPLIAETKAIPAHNATVWSELHPLFRHFEKRVK